MNKQLAKVRDTIALADRNTVTDRRKFLQQLQDIYDDEECIAAIDHQTNEDFNSSTSWNQIMLSVHRVALIEAERFDVKKSSRSDQTGYSASVMLRTVSLATNTADLALNCDHLMSILILVWSNQTYSFYRDTYVLIFVKYVLPKERYRLQISGAQWREILRLNVSMYSENSNPSKRDSLKAIRLIVKSGSPESHLSLDATNILLPFLAKVFRDVRIKKDEFMSKQLYKLTSTVCQQIGTESPIALGDFTKKNIPLIIRFDGSPEMYEMLLILIKTQRPNGITINHDSDDEWDEIIQGIYGIIQRGITEERLNPSFLKLCCEVYREVFQDPKYLGEGSSSSSAVLNPAKMQRLSVNYSQKPTDTLMLKSKNIKENWPFIQIFIVLLRKYPEILRQYDYPEFLGNVANLMEEAAMNNQEILTNLCELAIIVIVKFDEEIGNRETQVERIWHRMWETIVRQLGMNKSQAPCHKLLRSLIQRGYSLNPQVFLRLYLKRSISSSSWTVKTLLTYCQNVSLRSPDSTNPDDQESSTRSSLLQWSLEILQSERISEIPIVPLSKLLTILTLKYSYMQEYRNSCGNDPEDEKNLETTRENEIFENWECKSAPEVEMALLALKFRGNIFEERGKRLVNSESLSQRNELLEDIFNLLIDSLIAECSKIIEIQSEPEVSMNIRVRRLAVIAKVISNFLDLNVEIEKLKEVAKVFGLAHKSVLLSLKKEEEVWKREESELLECLEKFYLMPYHEKLENLIDDQTFALRFPSCIKKFSLDVNCAADNASRLKNPDRLIVYLCCTRLDSKKIPKQIKLASSYMERIDYCRCVDRNGCIVRFMRLITGFGFSEQTKSEDYLKMAIESLKKALEVRGRDERVVRMILNVIPRLMKSSKAPETDFQLIDILREIKSLLSAENYGPFVHEEFVKSLGEIIQLNPSQKWKLNGSPIVEYFVKWIKDPFHAVRLQAVRVFCSIFSLTEFEVDWKIEYLEKITRAISDLFDVDDSPDESETKKNTALHVLAAVVRGSDDSRLHSRVFISIIELSMDKGIEPEKIREALILSARNRKNARLWPRKLVEMNLHKLLTCWMEKEYPLEIFPWILTDCESHKDFIRRYIEILVAIKLRRGEFPQVMNLCKSVDISFTRTVENAFPSIMAQLLSRNSFDSSEIHEKLRTNSGEFSNVQKFGDLLEEKLPQVVAAIVARLHDEKHFSEMFNGRRSKIRNLSPAQPVLDEPTVERAFRLLGKDLNTRNSIVQHLVSFRPNALQKVLLLLLEKVEKSGAFHQFCYFYGLVIEQLPKEYFDRMSNYVIRDLSHSLLSFIAKEGEIAELACLYFEKFLVHALPSRAEEIGRVFNKIVSTLVPIAGRIEGAISLLRYLIIDQQTLFSSSIGKLDSLPNDKMFEEMKQLQMALKYGTDSIDLETEIQHFLQAINAKMTCSLEGLIDLNKQLSTRKTELRKMYNKLEVSRGFSEDCASSALHKLIIKLVDLTKSKETEISIEAAKCLGQLGPADLATIILGPEINYQGGNIDELTVEVIKRLSDFLVDCDINLRKSSAGGLDILFSTSWARTFAGKASLEAAAKSRDENVDLYFSVYPFLSNVQKSATTTNISIDWRNLEIFVESDDLWIPVSPLGYSEWIVKMTSRTLDCFTNFYARALKPISELSVEFSAFLLPRLIYLMIKTENSIVNRLCGCINSFFANFFEATHRETKKRKNREQSDDFSKSHECIKCMLSVVNSVRIYSIESNETVALDYLFIANAADYSSAYFTSLLYAELSCQRILLEHSVKEDGNRATASWISAIDLICDFDPGAGKLLQYIVREACLHIGNPDSIYGCGSSHLINSTYRAQHYIHLKQWDKVMLEQDMQLNCVNSATSARRDMLNALQQSGHHCLAGLVIKNTSNRVIGGHDMDEDLTYETMWRLTDWSQHESTSPTATMPNTAPAKSAATIVNINQNATLPISEKFESHDYHYSRHHYRALEFLRDGNLDALAHSLIDARTSIVESLRNTNLECSQTVYPMLSKLQMLREIQEFSSAETSGIEDIRDLINSWNEQDYGESHDFQYVEPILSQRLSLYQIRKSRGTDIDLGTINIDLELIDTRLKIAQLAEKQGFLSAASRALNTLAENTNLSDIAKHHLMYHKALLAWKEDQRDISRYLLRDLIKKPTLGSTLRAKALRICGNWMAESKCENPKAIINKYYAESVDISRSLSDMNAMTDAQADLGQFADFQYQQMMRFTKSTRYDNLPQVSSYGDHQTSARSRRKSSIDNDDETEALIAYRQLVTNDASALEDINREKDMYLLTAANNYLMTLQNGTNHDVLIFRLVSLWLENTLHPKLNEILRDNLPRIASHKFIILLCQIAPHMSNVLNEFTSKINDLMERCAIEHPHHTLPVLLALKNTHKDEEFKSSDKTTTKRQLENRVIATHTLVSKLLRNGKMRPIIQEISQLSEALIMLAYYSQSPTGQAKKTGVPYNIPRTQAVTKIRDFHHTTVPTITLTVNPSGKYENIIGIREYETKYKIPGGVNAPKIVVCIGTDGVKRRELVKGQDDLRQDAVMQQVCTVVNSMLKASRETKRRRLHIRTYKIVPLSRRSGVLEWCENTLPISHVLTDVDGKAGMHTKYYPNDWSVKKCLTTLGAVKDSSRSVKLATFLECCANLHPAFHHFFMEKYPLAETWFERRLAYVRSVATTSMVGYMLGLGDRHFSNILIDQTTAEVIHIDFGIAFAQGKVLPIPETVPFRLTRDMEVAMGICGVEGVMRRSCEETLGVLRDRRETLITVLQVLLYDPLFSWSITPTEKPDNNENCSGRYVRGTPSHTQDTKKTNEIAEKALLKIDEKLQGRSADGLILSIAGQVERLIQQARDPANLSRIYCGWQPYL